MDEDLLLSEKLTAMKITLIDNYHIGEFVQFKIDDFIKECQIMETSFKNEEIRESVESVCQCKQPYTSFLSKNCNYCGKVVK